jgi:hypothetical protein
MFSEKAADAFQPYFQHQSHQRDEFQQVSRRESLTPTALTGYAIMSAPLGS